MKIPHLPNAYKNIKKKCDSKLKELYPVYLPQSILSRYETELNYLKDSDHLDDFEMLRLLSEEATKCAATLSMNGATTGSLLYFLLGNNCYNPLPTHYYCPKCGYYEEVQTHLFGIDLPDKECPQCKSSIYADGFNIPIESVWGNDGKKVVSFEHQVAKSFLPFARKLLHSLYPENSIVTWGMFQFDTASFSYSKVSNSIDIQPRGYVILPQGNSLEDYPDTISYLDNGEPCFIGNPIALRRLQVQLLRLYSCQQLDNLADLQCATGIYTNDISTRQIRDITWSNVVNTSTLDSAASELFYSRIPKSYYAMTNLAAAAHNSYVGQEIHDNKSYRSFYDLEETPAFQTYPCYIREDFFEHFLRLGLDRSTAFELSEDIRKGRVSHGNSEPKLREQNIPEYLIELAKSYIYIFPRAHSVEKLLLEARIAYYAKQDSRAFGKVMCKKGK